MRVIDLRLALEKMDPNLEVFFDATPVNSDMFKFVRAESAEEVTTSENERMCLISNDYFEENHITPN